MSCKQCKHWYRDNSCEQNCGNDSIAYKAGLGVCKAAVFLPDAFDWDTDSGEEDEYGNSPIKVTLEKETGIFVMDGSSYKAFLYTRPTFGCNQFEDKNDK